MSEGTDEQLGPARRCTCGARAVCVQLTWDASQGHDGSAGAGHAGSEELTYRCSSCGKSFQLDSMRGTVWSGLLAALATSGATWALLNGQSELDGHWRGDRVFLAVIGFAASALAVLRIARQAGQRRRFPRLDG